MLLLLCPCPSGQTELVGRAVLPGEGGRPASGPPPRPNTCLFPLCAQMHMCCACMHAWVWRPNWDWVKGRGAEVRGGRSPGWRRQGSGAQDVVCGRMIDTSPLLELALPQPRSLPVGQGNAILGCQGIPLRKHSGKTASRRGFRITQRHNAEAHSLGWRVRGCRGQGTR